MKPHARIRNIAQKRSTPAQATAVREPARKRLWRCGSMQAEAYTKSEARALFIGQLRAAEALSFRPRRIERLPVGMEVVEVQ